MYKSAISSDMTIGDVVKYRKARVSPLNERVSVIESSLETIFGIEYMSAVLNNRLVKFRKSALEFDDERA